MDKATLTKLITKIFNMNNEQLTEQALTVSMSNVDDKAKYFLNKAIALRREELAHLDTNSALLIDGEYDTEALGN